jgi:Xaa-Pro dipeptidase
MVDLLGSAYKRLHARFIPTAEWVLEPGMCFHMYTAARGMAFSESVLVTERGPQRLTQSDRNLFIR